MAQYTTTLSVSLKFESPDLDGYSLIYPETKFEFDSGSAYDAGYAKWSEYFDTSPNAPTIPSSVGTPDYFIAINRDPTYDLIVWNSSASGVIGQITKNNGMFLMQLYSSILVPQISAVGSPGGYFALVEFMLTPRP